MEIVLAEEITNENKPKWRQLVKYNCVRCGKEEVVQFRHYKQGKLCPNCGRSVNNKSSDLEVIAKREKTNKIKYGDNWKKVISQKQQNSMIEKYGAKQTMLVPELKSKVEKTQTEKYGGIGFASEEIHKKTIESGKRNNSYKKRSFWKNKTDEEIKKIVSRMGKRYTYKNLKFDSSWELAYYIYNEDNGILLERESKIITYFDENNKEHKYVVDFSNNEKNIEIKSKFLIKKMEGTKKLEIIRDNCEIISNNEIKFYLNYVKNKYGNNYLNNFRNY